MEIDNISLLNKDTSNFKNNYLCSTSRYVWKLKEIIAENSSQLNTYFNKKKNYLLDGKEPTDASSLLALLPEPWMFKDIQKAAERIIFAIQKSEKITIFGDYDVDGTTSCAMLSNFFAELGYPVDVYIPDRILEGYGLNVIGLKKIASDGTKVVITVDNGISAVQACEEGNKLGLDIIITDHHDIPPVLPNAFAILNPKQEDCLFPYRMLAGVGVAFYLMIAIRIIIREQGQKCDINLKNYLDFVAIGTIADMAPLTGVNHILCKIGLEVLIQNIKLGKRIGIHELLKCAGWKEHTKIDSVDIGFKIGPRLNAAGRLGNALRSVEILSTNDSDAAYSMAHHLHQENAERQTLEKLFTQEALDQVNLYSEIPDALVLHKEDWHPGVVGLVATRVLDKFYRPVLVFGTIDGKLKGSGRSTHSFNLFSVLNEVRDQFVSFGGHYHAVGLTILPEKLEWLKEYLANKAKELILSKDKVPPLNIDGLLSLESIDLTLLSKLEELEPYGIENPRTKWLVGPVTVAHVKRMGKDISQNHAKVLFLEQGKESWLTAFGLADVFEGFLETGIEVQLVVEAKLSSWNGKMSKDIRVIDYAPVIFTT
ncbi:single-stranded-DNA-specific exonuclease RecJ [Silvanigrella sp.]|jgi:single-stranded-DNA-specific exonuclease|uniref:single-stranded-DNA-specific exonuclease RecJ n=1 Tax=Silvanigrella sp. TaxID=2024976 RepID=UPI0037CC325F